MKLYPKKNPPLKQGINYVKAFLDGYLYFFIVKTDAFSFSKDWLVFLKIWIGSGYWKKKKLIDTGFKVGFV